MEAREFSDNARARKAQLFVAYLVHLGVEDVSDWGDLMWEAMAEGASDFHGQKVIAPSNKAPFTSRKMIGEHLRGYWKRQALERARSSAA